MPHRGDCQGFAVNYSLAIISYKTNTYIFYFSKSFNLLMKKIAFVQDLQFTTYSGKRRKPIFLVLASIRLKIRLNWAAEKRIFEHIYTHKQVPAAEAHEINGIQTAYSLFLLLAALENFSCDATFGNTRWSGVGVRNRNVAILCIHRWFTCV